MATETEHLHGVLGVAEAALARDVIESADVGASWTETNRKLVNVRMCCRELRAALLELDASQSLASINYVRTYCRELRLVFLELNPSAVIPFRCDEPSCSILRSPRTTCWLDHLKFALAPDRRLETFSHCLSNAPETMPGHADQSAANILNQRPRLIGAFYKLSPLRRSVDLLALELAYLQYYFLDVQVQIAVLHSVFH